MSGRLINGEGSIYPYPHGYRAYVWVTTPGGRRQRKYAAGRTREEVREKCLKLHEASRRGPVTTKVPTLARFLAGWLEEVIAQSLAPATLESYRMCTRLYILPQLGGKRLDKLTVRDVQAWLNRMRTTCQCCAQSEGLDGGGCTPIPESSRDSRDPYHAGYVLLLVLGLRRGEVLGLTWPDVDLAAGAARIQWQLQRVDGSLALRRTKTTSSEAVLPLPEICAEALTSHRAMTNVWRLAARLGLA